MKYFRWKVSNAILKPTDGNLTNFFLFDIIDLRDGRSAGW